MARRLFGTDGVRGVAGEFLTAELALALGRAASAHAGRRPQVLIVRDTRESGEMLQAALAAGVTAAGGDALLGGVLPTPAAPLLIGRYGFDLAAVLSASHNPYRDNGIKFFARDGYKLSDDEARSGDRAGALWRAAASPRGRRSRDGGDRAHPRAAGSPRGLPARAPRALRRARPDRARRRPRLRQRRHLPRRAGDLQTAGCDGDGNRRGARRAQHQRGLRLHAHGALAETVRAGGTRSASPSTATAIACSRWTGAESSSTATS